MLFASKLRFCECCWFLCFLIVFVLLVKLSFCTVMRIKVFMMTSSNGNIFRVTGPGEFPTQRPVTRSFDVFFDLRLNNRLSKHSWGWWFETLSCSLWRHRNIESRIYTHTHTYDVLLVFYCSCICVNMLPFLCMNVAHIFENTMLCDGHRTIHHDCAVGNVASYHHVIHLS